MTTHGIYKFLEKRKVNKDEKENKPPNFTSLGRVLGSYHIPDDDLNEFYDLYVDAIDKGAQLSLTEKPGEYAPLLVDLDFRFPIDDLFTRKFSKNFIRKLSCCYFDFFKKYIKIEPERAYCYVFTRKEPYADKGLTKDGIHLIFPYIHVRQELRYLSRRYVIDNFRNEIENLKTLNPVEDVVDLVVGM